MTNPILAEKRTFLITGATRGIGLAITERMTSLGHTVVGIARTKPEVDFPGILYCIDLADEKSTLEAFLEIQRSHSIDGIVNNVGIANPQSLEQLKLSDLMAVLDLNLRPAFQSAQMFSPRMAQQKWGRVVNIASRAVLGLESRSSYAAAKSALIAFTRTWALELAKSGITVNAVAPGPTETELFRLHRPVGSEAEKRTLQTLPLGRIGTPREIAAAVGFFLSEEAGFVTGQTLFVDGGGSIASRAFV